MVHGAKPSNADGFEAGQTLWMAMELQQNRDAVTGTFWLGGLDGPFTGSVATGGNLTGEAKYTYTYEDGAVLDILVSPFSVLREGDRITQGTSPSSSAWSAWGATAPSTRESWGSTWCPADARGCG